MNKKLFFYLPLLIVVVFVSSCYWTPENSESGGTVTLEIATKDTIEGDYVFHITFWDPDDIEGFLELDGSGLFIPEPDAEPILINGEDEFIFEAPSGYDPWVGGQSGTITIPEIPSGISYKMRLEVRWHDSQGGIDDPYYHGLSEPFEVTPGGNVDVQIDIYNASEGGDGPPV
jgi:hypothetical protein